MKYDSQNKRFHFENHFDKGKNKEENEPYAIDW